MAELTRWPSPAKINLFLHVLGRRPDGYHRLQTVFQLLDVGDSVEISVRQDGQITRPLGAVGVAEADDLAVRAALALKFATGSALGAEIHVHKRIPLGAGLGGGSSNAATTLVALNALWKTRLNDDQLAAIGVTLGADVPVFVRGFSAFAEGVGDVLTRVTLPERVYLIATAPVFVSTRDVFTDPGLTRNTPPLTIASWLAGAPTQNDCWAVVKKNYAAIAHVFERLQPFGEVRLSGTGASVFVGFSNSQDAMAAQRSIKDVPSFLAAGVNRSPLLQSRSDWLGRNAF